MKFDEKILLLYAVTDRAWIGKQTLPEQIEDALKGGATIIQLREKKLDEDSFVKEAIWVRELCHKYNVPLIINDNVDVALKSGADGVHVGIEDIPVAEIRKRVPADFIIGATCKTVEQAKLAESQAKAAFGGGNAELLTKEVSGVETVVDAMVAAGVAKSKGEARRLIEQGGVSVDETKVTDANMPIPSNEFVLHKGKKVHLKIVIK